MISDYIRPRPGRNRFPLRPVDAGNRPPEGSTPEPIPGPDPDPIPQEDPTRGPAPDGQPAQPPNPDPTDPVQEPVPMKVGE